MFFGSPSGIKKNLHLRSSNAWAAIRGAFVAVTSLSFLHFLIGIVRVFSLLQKRKYLRSRNFDIQDFGHSHKSIRGTLRANHPDSFRIFYPQPYRAVLGVMKKSNLKSPGSNGSTAQKQAFPIPAPDLQPLDSATTRQPLLDSTSSCTRTRTRVPKTQIEVHFWPNSKLSQGALVRETVTGQATSGEKSSIQKSSAQKSSIAEAKGRTMKVESGLEMLLVLGRGTRQRTRPSQGPNSKANPRFPARKVRIIIAGDWQAQVKRTRAMENSNQRPDGPNPEESLPARNAPLSLRGAASTRRNPSPEWRSQKDRIRNALRGPRPISATD